MNFKTYVFDCDLTLVINCYIMFIYNCFKLSLRNNIYRLMCDRKLQLKGSVQKQVNRDYRVFAPNTILELYACGFMICITNLGLK